MDSGVNGTSVGPGTDVGRDTATDVGSDTGVNVGVAAAAAWACSASVGVEVGVALSPTGKGSSCAEQATASVNITRIGRIVSVLRINGRSALMAPLCPEVSGVDRPAWSDHGNGFRESATF